MLIKKLKTHSFCIIKKIIKKEQIKLIQKLFKSRFHSISEKEFQVLGGTK